MAPCILLNLLPIWIKGFPGEKSKENVMGFSQKIVMENLGVSGFFLKSSEHTDFEWVCEPCEV